MRRELDQAIDMTMLKDKDVMSMAACLNRIRINVHGVGINDIVLEELKSDFEYVGDKMGVCVEEAAILSCIIEKGSGSVRVRMRTSLNSWVLQTLNS